MSISLKNSSPLCGDAYVGGARLVASDDVGLDVTDPNGVIAIDRVLANIKRTIKQVGLSCDGSRQGIEEYVEMKNLCMAGL